MMKLLPCPFCGKTPVVGPQESKVEGDGWGIVRCDNQSCHVNPEVTAYQIDDNIEETSGAYKLEAIKRWNTRKCDCGYCTDCVMEAARKMRLPEPAIFYKGQFVGGGDQKQI